MLSPTRLPAGGTSAPQACLVPFLVCCAIEATETKGGAKCSGLQSRKVLPQNLSGRMIDARPPGKQKHNASVDARFRLEGRGGVRPRIAGERTKEGTTAATDVVETKGTGSIVLKIR